MKTVRPEMRERFSAWPWLARQAAVSRPQVVNASTRSPTAARHDEAASSYADANSSAVDASPAIAPQPDSRRSSVSWTSAALWLPCSKHDEASTSCTESTSITAPRSTSTCCQSRP